MDYEKIYNECKLEEQFNWESEIVDLPEPTIEENNEENFTI